MRAVIVRTPGPLSGHRVEVVADPAPGEGQVLIEARAIGVNYPDLLVAEGKYQVRPPVPFSPGKELAGVVAALGRGATGFRVGGRVMAQVEYGAYAEKALAPQAACHTLPDTVSFEQGAALGLAYQTAHFALVERARCQPGETVLVTGATGGVGLAAVEVAKALGATVLAGVTSKDKGELARAHGADHVVDLALPELREALRAQVFAAVGKHGADVVVELVGGDAFQGALRSLAWRGRLVVAGFAGGSVPEIKANYLLLRNIAVVGLQWSDYRDRDPGAVRAAQQELYRWHAEGKLAPLVSATYPLEGFAEALGRFRSRSVRGKMLLVPRADS